MNNFLKLFIFSFILFVGCEREPDINSDSYTKFNDYYEKKWGRHMNKFLEDEFTHLIETKEKIEIQNSWIDSSLDYPFTDITGDEQINFNMKYVIQSQGKGKMIGLYSYYSSIKESYKQVTDSCRINWEIKDNYLITELAKNEKFNKAFKKSKIKINLVKVISENLGPSENSIFLSSISEKKEKFLIENNLLYYPNKNNQYDWIPTEKVLLENKQLSKFDYIIGNRIDLLENYLNNTKDNDIDLLDPNGLNLLMYAAEQNNLKMVKLLIKFGADVNIEGFNNRNVLDYAAINNNDKLFKFLIEKGAAIKVSQLFTAVSRNNINVIDILLSSGIDVNSKLKFDNNRVEFTSLGWFIEDVNLETMEFLLTKGFNPDFQVPERKRLIPLQSINAIQWLLEGYQYKNEHFKKFTNMHRNKIKLLLHYGVRIDYDLFLSALNNSHYDIAFQMLENKVHDADKVLFLTASIPNDSLSAKLTKKLIEKNKINTKKAVYDVGLVKLNNLTPLWLAVLYNNKSTVNILVDINLKEINTRPYKLDGLANDTKYFYDTPIDLAIKMGNLEIFNILNQYNANLSKNSLINAVKFSDNPLEKLEYGKIIDVIKSGVYEIIHRKIENDRINIETSLHHYEITKYLLSQNIQYNNRISINKKWIPEKKVYTYTFISLLSYSAAFCEDRLTKLLEEKIIFSDSQLKSDLSFFLKTSLLEKTNCAKGVCFLSQKGIKISDEDIQKYMSLFGNADNSYKGSSYLGFYDHTEVNSKSILCLISNKSITNSNITYIRKQKKSEYSDEYTTYKESFLMFLIKCLSKSSGEDSVNFEKSIQSLLKNYPKIDIEFKNEYGNKAVDIANRCKLANIVNMLLKNDDIN